VPNAGATAGEQASSALTGDQAASINRRLFETSLDLILVTTGWGRLAQVSPSSRAILGYEPEEIVGRLAADFIYAEDLDSTREEMRAARQGRATRHFSCRYVHKDGHAVPLVWMGVWSEPDRHHFFIGRDMTERERAEAQLRQSQKMEAVGQLTGGVAHDFNNILTVIMANVDSLQDDEVLGEEARARLEQIGGAAQRAADLTAQLLAFSRKQALRPRRTDLNELVATTGKLLRRTLGERIEIDSALAEDLWVTHVDRAQLEAALVNLCVNARDAMPGGGKLLIETRNVVLDQDNVAQEPDVTAGPYVLLSVTDNGSGIPPGLLVKVFEPFFTTKDVGKGSGLGLSMVYGFIKQSRGHIKIYSEVGRGTSVKLYLPRIDGSAETAAAGPIAIPRGNERVLVAEDEKQVRASVVLQLRSLGYAVTEAEDGTAALARLDESAAAPYALLLTDVVMPGVIDGVALAAEVQRRHPKVRIVFMSGYSEDAVIQHGRLGPDARLLNKPFRKADLARIVRSSLDAPA
jgi:PAS domain S-box-containing protein